MSPLVQLMDLIGHSPEVAPTRIAARPGGWLPQLDSALVPLVGANAATVPHPAGPDALVVTTGQQPGLFTGPAYTVHKALAAAAVAKRLAAAWGRPVQALYWLAGDDHDFTEASAAAWPDLRGAPVHWALPPRRSDAPQHPMSATPLPTEILDGVAALEAALPLGPAREEAMHWLRQHYRPGTSVHEAFRGALAELLTRVGVRCIDPTTAAFKQAQAPLLREALRRSDELDALLATVEHPGTGIAAGDGASLVFLTTAAGRERLVRHGAGFRARRSGETFTFAALETLLERTPERFSANVLLRPVVESALLPTVAYVAGPGEFRYLTRQAALLYDALDVPRQRPVPRWGATMVEPWVDRILGQLGVAREALLADDGTLARRLRQEEMPEAVTAALAALQGQIAATATALTDSAAALDAGLVRAVQGRTRHLARLVEGLDVRFQGHLGRRQDTRLAQYHRALQWLRPEGGPQERSITGAAWWGRYGVAWLDQGLTSATRWAADAVDPIPAGE